MEQNNEQKKSGFVTLIGRPNVGKSTLMNHLIGQKIAITSSKPQTTRNRIQTVYTDDRGQIVFLDTPGILWPKFEDRQVGLRLALAGSMNDEILNISELALELIRYMKEQYPGMLNARYGVLETGTCDEILSEIADNRKCIKKGNEPDYDKAAAILLDEFRGGILGKIVLEFPDKLYNTKENTNGRDDRCNKKEI